MPKENNNEVNKKLKVSHLQDEIKFLKSQLESTDITNLRNVRPTDKLKLEINALEIKIRTQEFQQSRLEDKYQMLQQTFKSASQILNHSHTLAMDSEELELMAQRAEIKKNELLSSRNYIKEMQQVGWKNLPPKVVDNCKKSQLELEFIQQTIHQGKEEGEEMIIELENSSKKLLSIQTMYNERKFTNAVIEEEIDEIIREVNLLAKLIQSKQREAHDLEKTVEGIKKEIDSAIDEQNRIQQSTNAEIKKHEMLLEKNRIAKIERNKEIEDLKNINKELQLKYQSMEGKLRQKQAFRNEIQETMEFGKRKNYNLRDITNELGILENEIETSKEELEKEIGLKTNFFNILEDMMGRLKLVCRCFEEEKNKYFQIKNDRFISVITQNSSMDFTFDICHSSNDDNIKFFRSINNLCEMSNDGFNCYVVVMGGENGGKKFITMGENEDGLLWLCLNKFKTIINENKKAQVTTRMFVCCVEMTDDQIYDLISNKLNTNIQVKKDIFQMTLLCHAEYKECFAIGEVSNYLTNALKNRHSAANVFQTNDTTFVFLITFQVFNKFQRRYRKGKFTIVKCANFDTMKTLNDELITLTSGGDVNYDKTKITQLLEDCFGGVSKTCVVAAINTSPKYTKETIETLSLVSKLKTITNEITKNSEAVEIYRLKNDIERLLRGLKQEIL